MVNLVSVGFYLLSYGPVEVSFYQFSFYFLKLTILVLVIISHLKSQIQYYSMITIASSSPCFVYIPRSSFRSEPCTRISISFQPFPGFGCHFLLRDRLGFPSTALLVATAT